jgi:hypothetical protein
MALLDQLREQRATARASADEILTRAAGDGRDPAPDELAQYQAHVTAERERPPTPWRPSGTGSWPRSGPWPPAAASRP